jgi:Imidazolonepropionase and related amidohydrolases
MVDVEIDDPGKAAALVDSLKEQGVDLLKVYFLLRPEVLCAVIQEAHRQGLKVTGHIGVRTGWNQAIDCGIDGVNHIRLWADFLPLSEQPQGEDLSLDARIHTLARMQADWRSIDPNSPQVSALIQKMAGRHVGFDPTLSIQRVNDQERKSFSLQEFTLAQDAYQRMSQFVRNAQKDNVLLLAGTDDGSIFDEAESYEAAGVPRPEIIKALTVNGALWLDRSNDFGRIAPGEKADLVIVDGDPLKQIKDLRNVQLVVKDGTVVYEK